MTDLAALLAKYRPFVQYDSLESYYTDWAAVITDHPGNTLKRADGTVIAAAAAAPHGGNVPLLTLSFLRPDIYPTGERVLPGDFIGETPDYVNAARQMHARPGYANKAHGRIVEQAGRTWLQYWFFMYYDDPSFLDFGTHEGDIEMIQLRLQPNDEPDLVTYAQHRSGVKATWAEVEQQNGAPVVYSARGTHASMMRGGTLVSDRSLLPDHNDRRGPRVQLALVALSDAQTPWMLWPGHWGGTKPDVDVLGQVGVEADSPGALKSHGAWNDPTAFHNRCEAADVPAAGAPHTIAASAPPQPQLELTPERQRGTVNVKYTIGPSAAAPGAAQLVVGLDSSGGAQPPATTVIQHPGQAGELEARVEPEGGLIEVRATTHSADGGVSQTATAKAGD